MSEELAARRWVALPSGLGMVGCGAKGVDWNEKWWWGRWGLGLGSLIYEAGVSVSRWIESYDGNFEKFAEVDQRR